MNTDAIWAGPNPLSLIMDAWQPDKMDALLVCVPRDQAVGHSGTGDFILSETGQMTRGPGAVFGGIQVIKTTALRSIADEKFSLNVVWNMMLAQKRLYGLTYPGRWCDVGHHGGIALAQDMLKAADV